MEAIFGPAWNTLGGDIWFGTFAFMTVFAVFGISYKLARSYGDDGFRSDVSFAQPASFYYYLKSEMYTLTIDDKDVTSGAWGFVSVNYFNAYSPIYRIVVAFNM